MGDIKRNATINTDLEKLMEERSERETSKTNKVAVKDITKENAKKKTQAFSGRAPLDTWEKFKLINGARGISNNAAMNIALLEYVQKYEDLL